MEDVSLVMNKLKSYADHLENLFAVEGEKLFKQLPLEGEEIFCDGYRGFTDEEHGFMVLLLGDIRRSIKQLDAFLQEQNSAVSQVNRSGLIPVFAEGPAMLSGLVVELSHLLLTHGDLVVQVEGRDLSSVEPMLWTPEEQAAAGGGLRNCLSLGG